MNAFEPQNIQVNAHWDANAGIPTPANQFAILQGPANGGVISSMYEMHFGFMPAPFMAPDVLSGQMIPQNGIDLPIHRVGHFQMSIDLLRQMHEILEGVISAHDAQTAQGSEQ